MTTQLTPFLAMLNSPGQILVVLFIVLLLFGAKKLPDLAKGLGQAIREFSKAKNDIHDEIMRDPPPVAAKQIETPVVQATPAAGTQPVGAQQTTDTHV